MAEQRSPFKEFPGSQERKVNLPLDFLWSGCLFLLECMYAYTFVQCSVSDIKQHLTYMSYRYKKKNKHSVD